MDPKPFSTLTIPAHLLKATYLIGKTPFRACCHDPRISYTLYIPPSAYSTIHTQLQTSRPSNPLPLLVNIHGTRRDASRCRDSLIPFADKHGIAVLAPLFPAGLDGLLDLDSYKDLRSRSVQADVTFLSILNEVQQIWPGIDTSGIILTGFSGGAQFGHRFMYMYPDRVASAVFASPGGIALLNETKMWPKGVQDVESVFDGRAIDVQKVARIKYISLLVGENDTEKQGTSELKKWLASGLEVGKTAGRIVDDRVEATRSLLENWRGKGIESGFTIVPDAGHDYEAVYPHVVSCLEEYLAKIETVM